MLLHQDQRQKLKPPLLIQANDIFACHYQRISNSIKWETNQTRYKLHNVLIRALHHVDDTATTSPCWDQMTILWQPEIYIQSFYKIKRFSLCGGRRSVRYFIHCFRVESFIASSSGLHCQRFQVFQRRKKK